MPLKVTSVQAFTERRHLYPQRRNVLHETTIKRIQEVLSPGVKTPMARFWEFKRKRNPAMAMYTFSCTVRDSVSIHDLENLNIRLGLEKKLQKKLRTKDVKIQFASPLLTIIAVWKRVGSKR